MNDNTCKYCTCALPLGLETVHPIMTSLSNALRQLELPDGVYDNVDVFSGAG